MKFFKVVLASALGYLLVGIVVFFLFFVVIAGLSSIGGKEEVKIKDHSILHLKFNYAIPDRVLEDNPFEALSGDIASKSRGLDVILANIKKAKDDEHIEGILLDMSFIGAGMGKIEEIRNALIDFKESGKFIYSYAEVFYNSTYYLASVSDKVFLNPSGEFFFNGMVADIAFFKDALSKIGVEMQVVKHGRFKGAVEPYVSDKLSPDNRFQIQTYLNSIFDQTVNGIAESRGLDPNVIKEVASNFDIRKPEDALHKNFVDSLVYEDELKAYMMNQLDLESEKDMHFISLGKYAGVKTKAAKGQDKIAVIYAQGNIVSGKGNTEEIGSETMVGILQKVRKNKRIKAVVLRIDSRGGSALASDIITREAKLLAQEKPLVVSMSDVAASGGYYIASAGDTIIAQPTTVTGSIGVFGLIPNAQKLLNDKLGISFDYVKTGDMSDFGRIDRALTTKEREILQGMIEDIYDQFIGEVAESRGMETSEVDSIGQGRVWTGVMAKEKGLVDIIGGMDSAMSIAASMADLETYRVTTYPKKVNPFEQVIKSISSTSTQVKDDMIKEELGEFYSVYKTFKEVQQAEGVQLVMPYVIQLN